MTDANPANQPARNLRDRTSEFGATEGDTGIIRCDACPVLCRIKPGRSGACDRYANDEGRLIRCDPVTLTQRVIDDDGKLVPFSAKDIPEVAHDSQASSNASPDQSWDGSILRPSDTFVTGIGAGTTYPDYKPAPFIVSSNHSGLDTITIVTEGIFSYCGVKVKIDTDRHLGSECSPIFAKGQQVGHVTTAEYGSQMLSIGGVHHLTGGSKKEGRVTCETLLALCNKDAVELEIDNGSNLILQAGKAPVVNGVEEQRMRVGCGSATVGIFARQWFEHVDEVIVVDDHITGVLSEHQAGKCLGMPPTGIRVEGAKSTPGRYFKVANPGTGWGGTDITEPLSIIKSINSDIAWKGLRLLMTSTTGEDALYCTLDENLEPVESAMPPEIATTIERIGENCEPSLATVLFMAGAGGSLRAGVTKNPVSLTRSVASGQTRVTLGGAPVYIYPGGGITVMADVCDLPDLSFGYVPTPALVAPIEFTLSKTLYEAGGGHMDDVVGVEEVISQLGDLARIEPWRADLPWPFDSGIGGLKIS